MSEFIKPDPFQTPDPKPMRRGAGISRDAVNRVNAQWEDRGVMRGLLEKLAPYSPRRLTDAAGRIWTVLAQEGGAERVAATINLPLTASIVEGTKLELLGGAYQVGADGAWVTIPATAAATGTHAYFVVEQDANRAVTSATVVVNNGGLDPVEISGSTATSNVLIAEVVSSALVQRRHGNFTLTLDHLDGDFVRWPATVAGSIPS